MELRSSGIIPEDQSEIIIVLPGTDALFKMFIRARSDSTNLYFRFSPDGGTTRFDGGSDYAVSYVEGAYETGIPNDGETFADSRGQLISQSYDIDGDFMMVGEALIFPGSDGSKAILRNETHFLSTENRIGIQTWCARLNTVGRQNCIVLMPGVGNISAGAMWWLYGLPTPA